MKTPIRWKIRDDLYSCSDKGMIMGILNVTPDSFSDGGEYIDLGIAVSIAQKLIEEGADIIDVGGESTRPDALVVPLDIELKRTIPVIKALRKTSNCLISIDTSKAEVAEAAIDAGADIINDVTGLTGDVGMLAVCKKTKASVVVMHMQGNPRNMQKNPYYTNVIDEVRSYFSERLDTLGKAGVEFQRICLDPGIGFGKSVEHNSELLRRLTDFHHFERPIMVGASRKSLIGKILDSANPKDRDWGTVALTSYTAMHGAHIHRVHEVKKNAQALKMIEAIHTSKD